MKLKYHILVMTVVMVLLACTPAIKKTAGDEKAVKGKELYEQAEKLFKT